MKRLFVPPGTYEPCGLFGVEHLILLLASAALITAALYFSRRMSFPPNPKNDMDLHGNSLDF